MEWYQTSLTTPFLERVLAGLVAKKAPSSLTGDYRKARLEADRSWKVP